MKTFVENSYGEYCDSNKSNSIRACGATMGGGSEVLTVSYQGAMYWNGADIADTMTSRNAGGWQRMPDKQNFNCIIDNTISTREEKGDKSVDDGSVDTTVEEQNAARVGVVRRLTPDECASLQGFPRHWCDIGDWTDTQGKKHKDADTPKYKAYGNSIAVGFANERSGFWCWLMRRISAHYERRPTQWSLFSGIGGFDLAWAAVNGPESCRWSSEIEEFPIAVLKQHFGDEDSGMEGDFYKAINE